MMPQKFRNFEEFWLFYVREHTDARSRQLHVVGTALSFVFLAGAAFLGQPLLLLGAVAAGYGFSWAGHFFIQKNQPASLRHPLYSLLADWRMFGLVLNGRMNGEVERIAGNKSESFPETLK